MEIDKIDKYIKRYASEYSYSSKSRYYTVNSDIIRVSDHVGRNSEASLSIIITKNNDYILYNHNNGELANISYNDLKKMIRTIGSYGSFIVKEEQNKILNNLRGELKTANENINILKNEASKNKKSNSFLNSFRLFQRLTNNQKLAVCSSFNKTEITDLTPEQLISVMGTSMVQRFLKGK